MVLRNLDSCMQINETRTHPHTMHQNKLKMAERLKCKIRDHKTPGREHRQNILSHQPYKHFFHVTLPNNRNKSKNKPMGPHQTDKHFHSKGKQNKTKKDNLQNGRK